jgi:hypothetical protein
VLFPLVLLTVNAFQAPFSHISLKVQHLNLANDRSKDSAAYNFLSMRETHSKLNLLLLPSVKPYPKFGKGKNQGKKVTDFAIKELT